MSEPAPADTFDVVVIGSLNVDLVVRTPRLPSPGETVSGSDYHEFPGGKGLNQAVAAARCGASVAIIGAVGDDGAGRFLREVVRSDGIDDRWLRTVPGSPTGRALISVDDHAENSIVVVPGANAEARWPERGGPRGTVVLAQLEIPVDVVATGFALARSTGSTTILNPAPADSLPADLLANTSIVVPNQHEAEVLGGVESLVESGVETVVTTLGSDGVRVDDRNASFTLDAFAVEPVDTTGAGDAFCGNLAARLAVDADLAEAVRWASAAGSLATTVDGAVPSLPRHAAVTALLECGHP